MSKDGLINQTIHKADCFMTGSPEQQKIQLYYTEADSSTEIGGHKWIGYTAVKR